MPKFLFLLLFFGGLTLSCSSSTANQENTSNTNDELAEFFPNFPEQPFFNFQFNDDMSMLEAKLKKNGCQKSGIQDLDWTKSKSQLQLLFTDTEILSNFRIVFYDKNEAFHQKIEKKLEKNAVSFQKSEENEHFSCFEFETTVANYSVSLYFFESIVRLHYKPSSWH